MREEITEPQHWRANRPSSGTRKDPWSSRRPLHLTDLAADAIDAALADEEKPREMAGSRAIHRSDLPSSDIIGNLTSQLDLLEKQREQLLQLLMQAQAEPKAPSES